MRVHIMTCASLALAATVSLFCTAPSDAAAIVMTNEAPGGGAPGDAHDPSSAGGPDQFSASSVDILQGLTGVYSGNTAAGALAGTYPNPMAEVSAGAVAWTDGILINYYPGDVDGDGGTSNDIEDFTVIHQSFGTAAGTPSSSGFVTFDLGGLYDLTGVDVFTGWNDGGRDDASFEVQVAGNDGIYSTIDSYAKVNDSNQGTVPTNFISFSGLTASSVRYLQLAITDADNDYIGIMEIDAFGTQVPEPAGLALLGLVAVGFAGRRRS